MVGPLEVPEKFRVVGGGLLDFKVYLSPLLGEGVLSMIERCRERVGERCRERFLERERERRVREGEGRDERGEERDCDNFSRREKNLYFQQEFHRFIEYRCILNVLNLPFR